MTKAILQGSKGGQPLTQREVAESIVGLQQVARDLRVASRTPPLEGYGTAVVAVTASGISDNAAFIERVAEELLRLIDGAVAIEIPEK